MNYISTGMGNRFSALLVSLMALWLALVNQNCLFYKVSPNPLLLLLNKLTQNWLNVAQKEVKSRDIQLEQCRKPPLAEHWQKLLTVSSIVNVCPMMACYLAGHFQLLFFLGSQHVNDPMTERTFQPYVSQNLIVHRLSVIKLLDFIDSDISLSQHRHLVLYFVLFCLLCYIILYDITAAY